MVGMLAQADVAQQAKDKRPGKCGGDLTTGE
jgi:hypothetical protein